MKKLLLTALLMLSAPNVEAIAGSLYEVESPPFATFIARHPGDLLTVIVDEWSDTEDSGSRDHQRKTEAHFNLTKFFLPGFSPHNGFEATEKEGDNPGVSWDTESKFNSSANNKSGHTFETKLEVRLVEEVSPGQFIIRGLSLIHI